MTQAFLGLGGNLGDPKSAMRTAFWILNEHPQLSVSRVSSLYRTKPWGKIDQPDFLNCVATVVTTLGPRELLETCLSVESQLKRERRERWGPRIIDIDLLLYGNETVRMADLEIPHPRMRERAFVLVPLLEIAPEIAIDGQPAMHLLTAIGTEGVAKIKTAEPWYGG